MASLENRGSTLWVFEGRGEFEVESGRLTIR